MIDDRKKRCSRTCYDESRKKPSEEKNEQKRLKNLKKFEGLDESLYVECKICGFKAIELTTHITIFHKMKVDDYRKLYNVRYVVCEDKRKNIMGENNPAYQHNGRFSAWSKNFKNGYDKQRHGEFKREQSDRMLLSPIARETNTFCREFYTSDEEYVKSQTRNLSWFQNKYGDEEGKKRWQDKTEKWLNTLSQKSEEELNDINRRKVKKSGCFYSKQEKDLYYTLKQEFPMLTDQWCLKENGSEKRFLYDMTLEKKIIEYNGDFWHANPLSFDKTFVNPYTNESFEDIRKKDERKLAVAINQGYKVLVVWESDYRKNKQKEIERCLNFLTQ